MLHDSRAVVLACMLAVCRFLAAHHESLRPLGKASLAELGLATGSLHLAAGPAGTGEGAGLTAADSSKRFDCAADPAVCLHCIAFVPLAEHYALRVAPCYTCSLSHQPCPFCLPLPPQALVVPPAARQACQQATQVAATAMAAHSPTYHQAQSHLLQEAAATAAAAVAAYWAA
jgi:hypothetical protein